MIHDFATLPRQAQNKHPEPIPTASNKSRVRLGWPVLLLLVAGFAAFVRTDSHDAVVEYVPGEAESQEYLASGMQQVPFDEPEPVEATQNSSNVVLAHPAVALEQVVDNSDVSDKQEAANVAADDPLEPEYGFYESLSSSDWRVPVQTGVYFTEEDRIRTNAKYILQAASLKSRGEAERLVRKLKKLKMNASFNESQSSYGGVWYRVMVGPFTNHSLMNKAEDILASMHIKPLKRRLTD